MNYCNNTQIDPAVVFITIYFSVTPVFLAGRNKYAVL